jgi:putative acyl-CoA dehydrogenase
MKEFIQDAPILKNQFNDDLLLQDFLLFKLPQSYQKQVCLNLEQFGERVVGDIAKMAEDAEEHPPKHRPFDPWGNRIDELQISNGWKQLHITSAEEELVSLGYTREFKEYSRMIQFSKLYLFHPSSAFYSCPLAMTDGAAKLIETHGNDPTLEKAFAHLTSKDPSKFWISAQWMTERSGGSDVTHSETTARMIDNEWRLSGTKWFCSAVNAQMCLMLAQIPGSGLSLFYVELKHFQILRLKEKLGTKALPTAEVKLENVLGTLIGLPGSGVKLISSMFNVTRLYNAVTSTAAFRRILALACDYSHKRHAFNHPIGEHPLTAILLARARIEMHACFHLTFLVSEIIGNVEVFNFENSFGLTQVELSEVLRLLTPIVKLYTARKVIYWTSELLEVFGGSGYIEDTGIPRLIRDNQVFSLWEGTTNVLSLDMLRAMKKGGGVDNFFKMIEIKMNKISSKEFIPELQILNSAMDQLKSIIAEAELQTEGEKEAKARDIAFSLGNITAGVSMLELANHKQSREEQTLIAKIFLEKNPCHVEVIDEKTLNILKDLVL